MTWAWRVRGSAAGRGKVASEKKPILIFKKNDNARANQGGMMWAWKVRGLAAMHDVGVANKNWQSLH